MQKTFHLAALFAMCLLAAESLAQTVAPQTGPKATSLCVLQREVSEGKHETVRVSGVYGPGLDRTVLEDTECPSESTWVELALRSQENKEKLRKLLDSSRRAYVVVEGEFYGPPLPDPKLPEAVKKDYHPGWGHLAAFKTKLVVHAIRDVKPAPTDHTNGASLNHEAEHSERTAASCGPEEWQPTPGNPGCGGSQTEAVAAADPCLAPLRCINHFGNPIDGGKDEILLSSQFVYFIIADALPLRSSRCVEHGEGGNLYLVRRRWDYFVKYLLGVTPPANFEMHEDREPAPVRPRP